MNAKTLIIGIGNRLRGDDALGCLVAENLKNQKGAEVIEHDGEPASLMDRWKGYDRVILVDAVSSGAELGRIFRLDLCKQGLSDFSNNTSTHAFGVAEAVELARVLGKLPSQMIFYGIEANNFSTGSALSPELHSALKKIHIQIKEDLLNA